MLGNKTISETLAIKGSILNGAAETGSLYSNFASGSHTDRLQAVLTLGTIIGTADIAVQEALLNLDAVGRVTTGTANAGATAIPVSGGEYAENDWVSADGVNFVRVTAALSGAGNLAVTALPAAVASGAEIVALGNAHTIASLSAGGSGYPFKTQTPALAEEAGVYTLDVRASEADTNNPTPPGDGTGGGYNPAKYIRIAVTLDTGSNSTEVAALLLDGVKHVPAYELNAPGLVVNQIQA